jgi:hypothetical protein
MSHTPSLKVRALAGRTRSAAGIGSFTSWLSPTRPHHGPEDAKPATVHYREVPLCGTFSKKRAWSWDLAKVTCRECLAIAERKARRSRTGWRIAGAALLLVTLAVLAMPFWLPTWHIQQVVPVGQSQHEVTVRFETVSSGSAIDQGQVVDVTLTGTKTGTPDAGWLSWKTVFAPYAEGGYQFVDYRFDSMKLARLLSPSGDDAQTVQLRATILDGAHRGSRTMLTGAESIDTLGTHGFVTVQLPTQPTHVKTAPGSFTGTLELAAVLAFLPAAFGVGALVSSRGTTKELRQILVAQRGGA